MSDILTDADLIDTLRVRAENTAATTAVKLGIQPSALRNRVREAKSRGLTATTKIVDETVKLKLDNKRLKRELEVIVKDNITAGEIRETVFGLSYEVPDPPAWIAKMPTIGRSGVPMVLWSDWHWGEVVRAEEVGGVNSFNRAVAKERLRKLVDATLDLSFAHMVTPRYPGIVVAINGDIFSGDIHDELRESNDGSVPEAFLEVQEQMIAALNLIADKFKRVFVPCTIGNHGRTTLRPRYKGRVYTSYEWLLYHQLERNFAKDKRFRFLVPGETDAHYTVLGHRFHQSHGDTLGVRGGDGIIGAIGPIARGAVKVGRSEAQIGRDFDTLLLGHWHTYIPRGDATPVIVNGALKGYDEFARLALRVPYARPSQALWFVHEKYGITAQWQTYLDPLRKSADSAEWLTFEQRSKA